MPLARLTQLGLVKGTGDFRAGMLVTVALLAVLSAAFIVAASRIRGYTSVLDAFFPLLLLHLGHSQNLLWAWQLQFSIATVLVGALLLVPVLGATPFTPQLVALGGATGVVGSRIVLVVAARRPRWLAYVSGSKPSAPAKERDPAS